MNNPERKDSCCLKTAKVGSALANFIEEIVSDVSANTVEVSSSIGAIVGFSLLAIFSNLSGLIYDFAQLGVKFRIPESRNTGILIVRFIVAFAILAAYTFSTYNGSKEDCRPDLINPPNTTQPPLLINEKGVLSNETVAGISILTTSAWVLSEGIGGFSFCAGSVLVSKLLLGALGGGSRAEAEDSKLDQIKSSLGKVGFVVSSIGFVTLAWQAWAALFDVYALYLSSLCKDQVTALTGERVQTGFLAIALIMHFVDYYLRDFFPHWIHSCAASFPYRLIAELGVGAAFFGVSFNRASQFLNDVLDESTYVGTTGFKISVAYAAFMAGANVMRYGLYCREVPLIRQSKSGVFKQPNSIEETLLPKKRLSIQK